MRENVIRTVDTTMTAPGEFDERRFRDAMSRFATGVAVATTLDHKGNPVGVTISSLTSLSIDPPLVLWNMAYRAYSLAAFRRAGVFALNFLAEDQWQLCEQFAGPAADKFHGVNWQPDDAGVPLLDGMLAHISCTTWRRYPGGDHEIFIGQVRDIRVYPGEPLVVFDRGPVRLAGRDGDGRSGKQR